MLIPFIHKRYTADLYYLIHHIDTMIGIDKYLVIMIRVAPTVTKFISLYAALSRNVKIQSGLETCTRALHFEFSHLHSQGSGR